MKWVIGLALFVGVILSPALVGLLVAVLAASGIGLWIFERLAK